MLNLPFGLFFFVEGGVEGAVGGFEVGFFDEGGGFGGAVNAVHAGVFPLVGEGAFVADVVEGADDFLEVDGAVTKGAEVPVALVVAEVEVSAENAAFFEDGRPMHVFHVDVVDAVGEVVDETDVIDALVAEVRGVVVEAECFAVAERFEGTLGAYDVEGDLGGVDFERELDAVLIEGVENGIPVGSERLEAFVDGVGRDGRERVQVGPNGTAGEAVDDAHAQIFGGARGGLHFVGSALVDAFRVAVAPDVWGQYGFMTLVHFVGNGLTDQVVGDGEQLQTVIAQDFALSIAVGLVAGGFLNVEVIAPTGEFKSVEAHLPGEGSKFGERQIGPLAGKQGNWSCHNVFPMREQGYFKRHSPDVPLFRRFFWVGGHIERTRGTATSRPAEATRWSKGIC